MSNFKKFFLINENDYNLLKKTKGEQVPGKVSTDIDVQNNLALNQRLTEMVRDKTKSTEGSIGKRRRGSFEEEEEDGKEEEQEVSKEGDMTDGYASALNDTTQDEKEASLVMTEGKADDGKRMYFDFLRDYLPAKIADQGETFVKRILAMEGSSLNWEDKIIKLGENTFPLLDFTDFVLISAQKRKPTQKEKLQKFAEYLMENDFPSTLIANPYVRTMMIATRIDQRLESSTPKIKGEAPKLFSSPIKFDWYDTIDDVPN